MQRDYRRAEWKHCDQMSCLLGSQTVATVWDRALEEGRGRLIWNIFWTRTRKSYWQDFLVKKSQILFFFCHKVLAKLMSSVFVVLFCFLPVNSGSQFQVLRELSKIVCKIIECIYLYIYNFEGKWVHYLHQVIRDLWPKAREETILTYLQDTFSDVFWNIGILNIHGFRLWLPYSMQR